MFTEAGWRIGRKIDGVIEVGVAYLEYTARAALYLATLGFRNLGRSEELETYFHRLHVHKNGLFNVSTPKRTVAATADAALLRWLTVKVCIDPMCPHSGQVSAPFLHQGYDNPVY